MSLKVALIQQACNQEYQTNLAVSIKAVKEAAAQGAKLILLPELHTRPYFCQIESTNYFDWAEAIPGPTSQQLSELAKSLSVVLVASLFERRAPGLYHNTAVVFEQDGEIAGKYRKMHIPDDPGYYEKYYFTPGDLGFQPIETSVGRLGVLVCWDQWYPEAARLMALAGADILLYPTAIGWDTRDTVDERQRQLDAWTTIQRSHAIANGIPVMSCNRIGHEADPAEKTPGIRFWGSSFIAGAQGEILGAATHNDEDILIRELDMGRQEKVRRLWPYLRDRRIDAYDDILLRYRD